MSRRQRRGTHGWMRRPPRGRKSEGGGVVWGGLRGTDGQSPSRKAGRCEGDRGRDQGEGLEQGGERLSRGEGGRRVNLVQGLEGGGRGGRSCEDQVGRREGFGGGHGGQTDNRETLR